MPTTYEVIFIGTLAKIDTTQGKAIARDAAAFFRTAVNGTAVAAILNIEVSDGNL